MRKLKPLDRQVVELRRAVDVNLNGQAYGAAVAGAALGALALAGRGWQKGEG